jgi:hypothetical protein
MSASGKNSREKVCIYCAKPESTTPVGEVCLYRNPTERNLWPRHVFGGPKKLSGRLERLAAGESR